MLKIFLSSTYRDLSDYRAEILKELDAAFEGVGMEDFIPDGTNSQEVCIGRLKESDIVLFLISPYYGSLMEECSLIESCKADCPMKSGTGKISYTHCEYKTVIAEGILHQTYLINEGWDSIRDLNALKSKDIDLKKIKQKGFFSEMSEGLINHYINVSKEAWQCKEEISKEYYFQIENLSDPNLIKVIGNHLAENIMKWYLREDINFSNFCDRRDELNDLFEYIDDKVEVYGVGGVGKTSLIQVALLIQKLKGKKVITIGLSQSYASGSGYDYFRKKCRDVQYKITGNKISLDNIIDALSNYILDEDIIRKKPFDEKIHLISELMDQENILLYIDDFHLANEDVQALVKISKSLIISSRRNTGLARKEICLLGIPKKDRNDFINLLCARFDEEINSEAKENILNLTDGHPISTELLVKNYQKINLKKFQQFKLVEFKDSQTIQIELFLNRVIKEILSPSTNELLQNLSVLNVDLPTNINRDCVEKAFEFDNFNQVFNELIDSGMIKKKEGEENIYEFTYKHVQDTLSTLTDQVNNHNKALKYYEVKNEIFGDSIDDNVEKLYHQVNIAQSSDLLRKYVDIKSNILPTHYGFKRLIDIGLVLIDSLENEQKAMIYESLGEIFYTLKWFDESKKVYENALEIYNKLSETNKELLSNVAMAESNLGVLYRNLNKYEDAESSFLKSLEIRKSLKKKDLSDLAKTLTNLGILYRNLKRFQDAENNYIEALEIYRKLLKKNSDNQELLDSVATINNNLGVLFLNLKRYEDAEKVYLENLKTYQNFASVDPDKYKYLPLIATTHSNLGLSYVNLGKYNDAKAEYLKALEIRNKLAEKSSIYLSELSTTNYDLGRLSSTIKNFENAEKFYLESLQIRKELAKENPHTYSSQVINTLNSLGVLYIDSENFDKAINTFNDALEIDPKYHLALYNKACVESLRNNKEKAINFLKNAIELDKKYVKMAQNDDDFKNLKETKEFKSLFNKI